MRSARALRAELSTALVNELHLGLLAVVYPLPSEEAPGGTPPGAERSRGARSAAERRLTVWPVRLGNELLLRENARFFGALRARKDFTAGTAAPRLRSSVASC